MSTPTGVKRKHMIDAYIETKAMPTNFFSSWFQTPARNFFKTEEVEVDIKRGGRRIAIAVHDITSGSRKNVSDLFRNKKFKPPVLKESAPLTVEQVAFDRDPGENPFEMRDFVMSAAAKVMMMINELEDMHRRTIELQASQVFQGGVITLNDASDETVYELDYGVAPELHVNASVAWSSAGATPTRDIENVTAEAVTRGKVTPGVLVFGDNAWQNFIDNDNVKELLNHRRATLINIDPESRGVGAVLQGTIWIGSYVYEMWTYTGEYENPVDGVSTRYMGTDNCLVLPKEARFDLVFGNVPRFGTPNNEVSRYLPNRVMNQSGNMDMHLFAKLNEDKTALSVDVSSRPLCIPTAIDTFASINTNP